MRIHDLMRKSEMRRCPSQLARSRGGGSSVVKSAPGAGPPDRPRIPSRAPFDQARAHAERNSARDAGATSSGRLPSWTSQIRHPKHRLRTAEARTRHRWSPLNYQRSVKKVGGARSAPLAGVTDHHASGRRMRSPVGQPQVSAGATPRLSQFPNATQSGRRTMAPRKRGRWRSRTRPAVTRNGPYLARVRDAAQPDAVHPGVGKRQVDYSGGRKARNKCLSRFRHRDTVTPQGK
jgi:hypothetical protein